MANQVEDGISQGEAPFVVDHDKSQHPTLNDARRHRLKLLIGAGNQDQTVTAMVQNFDAIAAIITRMKARQMS